MVELRPPAIFREVEGLEDLQPARSGEGKKRASSKEQDLEDDAGESRVVDDRGVFPRRGVKKRRGEMVWVEDKAE